MSKKQDKAFKRTANSNDDLCNKDAPSELLEENKRLKNELKLAQMEIDILKKAQAYFKKTKN